MFDDIIHDVAVYEAGPRLSVEISGKKTFWIYKRTFDICVSLLLLPLLFLFTIALFCLNPFFNKGSLFFVQRRMGKDCKGFSAIKFRSMTHIAEILRSFEDPIEIDRITRLGGFIRATRIDELPQILNVLKGDMSLIGPRPDYYPHACEFLNQVAGYRTRHVVRPGISGLAQVSLGYAMGIEATQKKTNADQYYISNAGFKLDARIAVQTLMTVITKAGS